jgi:hypothetical protein
MQEKEHKMVAVMLMVLKGRKMKGRRAEMVAIVSLMLLFPVINAWGIDGHHIVCKIAQVLDPLCFCPSLSLSEIFIPCVCFCVVINSHA